MTRPVYYPVSAKRVIKVENFYAIIKVNTFKMDDINPEKPVFMDVSVEFMNTYCSGKDDN